VSYLHWLKSNKTKLHNHIAVHKTLKGISLRSSFVKPLNHLKANIVGIFFQCSSKKCELFWTKLQDSCYTIKIFLSKVCLFILYEKGSKQLLPIMFITQWSWVLLNLCYIHSLTRRHVIKNTFHLQVINKLLSSLLDYFKYKRQSCFKQFKYLFSYIFQVTFCCDAGWIFRFIHIGIGAVCLGAVLIILYLTETELTEFIVKHYKTPKSPKKEWN
jgi:hypothetical protein